MNVQIIARPQQRQALSGLSLNTLQQQPKSPARVVVGSDAEKQQQQQQQQPTASQRYKTELCRSYQENGSCKYGEKCQFAHGPHELRSMQRHPKYKTELCRTFHAAGYCPYGPRCHFVHDTHTDVQLSVKLATSTSSTSSSSSSNSSSSSSSTSSPLSLSRLHLDEIDSLFDQQQTQTSVDPGRSSLLMVSTTSSTVATTTQPIGPQPRKDSTSSSSSSSSSSSCSPPQSSRSLSPNDLIFDDIHDELRSTDLIVTQILSNIYLDEHVAAPDYNFTRGGLVLL